MKIQMKKVAWDDFVLLVMQLLITGILIAIFGPLSLVGAYFSVAFLHEAAERQGPIGVAALFAATFLLFFGLMALWWYLILSRVTGIPWSNEG